MLELISFLGCLGWIGGGIALIAIFAQRAADKEKRKQQKSREREELGKLAVRPIPQVHHSTAPAPVPPGYVVEEGLTNIDWSRVREWLSSSYWSPGITREQVERAARHSSLVLGAFKDGQQVAYLRVVSDKTRFAYLCDVWVEVSHRRRGLAQAMVRRAIEHPDYATVAWVLVTADAHALYEPLGFRPLGEPQRWMRRKPIPDGDPVRRAE